MTTVDVPGLPTQREGTSLPPCPYRGLRPFTEDDDRFFFGRDQDTRLIVNNLRAYRLTVLFGPSGVGKSSVLRAGVLRRIIDQSHWDRQHIGSEQCAVAYCSGWRDDPVAALTGAIAAALTRSLEANATASPDGVDLSSAVATVGAKDLDLLVVLDQFEEYFLYHEDEGDGFARTLAGLIQSDARINLLIAIREDALAKLDSFEAALPGVFDNTLRLEHLDRDSAREAVVEPLRRYNELSPDPLHRSVEDELVEDLLDQVQAGRVRVGTGTGDAGAQHLSVDRDDTRIEAPYLQLVLTRLWEAESAAGSAVLRRDTLHDLGGAQAIVREHLDRVVEQLEPGDRELLAAAFGYLVTPGGTKIAHTVSDLAALTGTDVDSMERVLRRLTTGDLWILREVPPPLDEGRAEPRFEIFHDVLALAALEWRRRWLALRSQELAHQQLMADKDRAERTARETRRRLRRSRVLSAALAALLVAGVALTSWAVQSSRRAEQQSMLAEQRGLLAEHGRLLATDPSGSLRTALDAWRQGDGADAQLALRQSLDVADARLVLGHGDQPVMSARYSGDGSKIVTAAFDGHIRVWSADDGRLLRDLDVEPVVGTRLLWTMEMVARDTAVVVGTDASVAALVPLDGGEITPLPGQTGRTFASVPQGGGRREKVLTTGPDDGVARLWDTRTGALLQSFGDAERWTVAGALDETEHFAVTWSPANGRLDERLSVWDTASGKLVAEATTSLTWPSSLSFVARQPGRVLASGTEGDMVIWNWQDDTVQTLPVLAGYQITRVAQDGAGRWFVVAADKRALVYDWEGQLLNFNGESTDWINVVAPSPDGHLIAAGGNDGEVQLQYADRPNNRPLRVFRGHGAAINDLAFASDGSALVTAGDDGTARVWGLPERSVVWGSGTWIPDGRFTADGRQLVTANWDGTVQLADVRTGRVAWQDQFFLTSDENVTSVDIAPDTSAVLVATGRWGVPYVMGVHGQTAPLLEMGTWEGYVSVSRWCPDQERRLIVGGTLRNEVIAWDSSDGSVRWAREVGDRKYYIADVAFSGDGSSVAALSNDGTVTLLDPSDGTVVTTVPSPVLLTDLALDADGSRLAASGVDRRLRVWDLHGTRREPVLTLDGPSGTIFDVEFSQDVGSVRLAAVGADGVTYVWDPATGRQLASMRQHGDAVNAVSFHPDDPDLLLTTSDDGTAAIYRCTTCPLDEHQLEAEAEKRLPREVDAPPVSLSAEERQGDSIDLGVLGIG